MSPFSQGIWDIESVSINSQAVVNDDGFKRLNIVGRRFAIEPAALNFVVDSIENERLVLVSQGQVFFAEFLEKENDLLLNLTRPKFSESVVIQARRCQATGSTAEREVVQV